MTTIDARELPAGSVVEADLCIVGAGAAGITIARELASSSVRVALLEAGGREYDRTTQSLYGGYNVGLPSFPTTVSRMRMLGGSTTAWAGQCAPLNEDDFLPRAWVPHSGWPFPLQALQPYYHRAQEMLGFGATADESTWCETARRPVLQLGHEALAVKMFRFCRITDFRVLHREEIEQARNITTYINANILRIEVNEAGNRVVGLTIGTLDGKHHVARARMYVLAAGGIENIRLLLASNRAAGGIGNAHGLVGRFFMDHPFVYCGVATLHDAEQSAHVLPGYDRLAAMDWRMATIQFSERWLRQEQLLNCGVHFVSRPAFKTTAEYNSKAGTALSRLSEALSIGAHPGPGWPGQVRRAVLGAPAIIKSRLQQIAHLLTPRNALALRVTLEHAPNPSSRVYLTEHRDRLGMPIVAVDWQMGELERRSLDCFLEMLHGAFPKAQLGSIELRVEEDDETGWPTSLSGGKHHMGGTRMHADSLQGVVDADCRVHGVENLYVAGSSVFPTCGYANPTFTILALAIRLAERLRSLTPGQRAALTSPTASALVANSPA